MGASPSTARQARRVRRETIRADGDRVVAHLAKHPEVLQPDWWSWTL